MLADLENGSAADESERPGGRYKSGGTAAAAVNRSPQDLSLIKNWSLIKTSRRLWLPHCFIDSALAVGGVGMGMEVD